MGEPPLTASEFNAAVTSLTSAFGDRTRRDIYLMVRDEDAGMTASAVAQRVDVHANVARHHLDKLAAGGYLEVTVERTSGQGAGRPSKHYAATNKEDGLRFGLRRDDLIGALLGRALGLLEPAEASVMAEEVGIEYGRAIADTIDPSNAHRSKSAAVAAVADALTSHGFAAHPESDGDSLRIVSENCPFGTVALEHPVLCAIDRGMVKGMLSSLYGEANPELARSLPDGDAVCIHTLT